jgi:hypothetical protein
MANEKAAAKYAIEPVIVTVKLKATWVSENGALGGWDILEAKAPNVLGFRVTSPPMAGGGIFLRAGDEKGDHGLKILGPRSAVKAAKPKLIIG